MSELDDFFNSLFDEPKETVEEAAFPVSIAALSPVDAARNKVLQSEAEEERQREELKKVREQYKAAQELMKKIQDEFNEANRKYQLAAMDKHEAQRQLTEAEHRAAEEAREKELQDQKLSVVKELKLKIDELDPVWRNEAFDHQWEGATTLALHGSALLGDDMGLGKTLTSIMYLDFIEAHRTLVIAPSDTVENYTLECMMWSPHRFTFTMANADEGTRRALMNTIFKRRLESGKDFILTINIEQLNNATLVQELLALKFDTIIVDEAHTFKNKKGKLFDVLKTLRYDPTSTVKHFLPMTGTFILNKPQDIWPALHLIDKDLFPTEQAFLNIYCDYDHYEQSWSFRSGGVTSLIKRLGGRIVMRTMEEAGIVIPAQTIHDETPAHLDACDECRGQFPLVFQEGEYLDQRRIMKQLAEHAQVILDSSRKTSVMEQIALITRNRQAVVWPGGINLTGEDEEGLKFTFSVGDDVKESIKLDWVERKIRSLRAKGKRIVVFSQFKTALSELESRLMDMRVVRYDGDTSQTIKSEVKRDFDRRHVDKNNGEHQWDIVLCNFKTGGVGLNFTHATEMIMADEEWNPSKNEQAYRRTKRMGQTEETNVWIPRVKKTIDMWMKQLNDRKRQMIDGFNIEVDMEKSLVSFLDIMKEDL
jgi:SNF2 family DNA or RNA helicase